MRYRILDLLACPADKSWPLELVVKEETIEAEEIKIPKENPITGVVCAYYCYYKRVFLIDTDPEGKEIPKKKEEIQKLVDIKDCQKCFQKEIISGTLQCKAEPSHTYEIKEGIPIMLTPEQKKELYKN